MIHRTFAIAILLLTLCWRLGSPAWAAEYVIHISVDGLRPSYMQAIIDAGQAPNLKRFQDEGAWTNNARTDFTHTNTLPNHTSMVTGRPVSLPAGAPAMTHHGYTDNDDPPLTETLHNFTNPDWYKASSFDVAHDAGLSTALYASKYKFAIYDQSYNATNGADHANSRDKIDVFANPEVTATMQSEVLAGLAANHFTYTFVHYADTDDIGHSVGWGTPTWNAALVTIDGYIGQVFNLVENDPTLAGKTAIILTADHGGTGTGHSTATVATNYTIPFFAWGAGVARGDLYALNPGARTDPGTGRPDYNAAGQPIRNGDSGNLALSLLGLGPVPGSLINVSQNLRVDAAADFDGNFVVDGADLARWRSGFGLTAGAATGDGDADADGDVDGRDFLVWQRQWAGAPALQAVPEPGRLALVVLGVTPALVALRSRCRRRLTAAA